MQYRREHAALDARGAQFSRHDKEGLHLKAANQRLEDVSPEHEIPAEQEARRGANSMRIHNDKDNNKPALATTHCNVKSGEVFVLQAILVRDGKRIAKRKAQEDKDKASDVTYLSDSPGRRVSFRRET